MKVKLFTVLVGDLHHGKAHDLVADLKALLEYLCDGVFRHTFFIGVHHRVVQIGVEGVALLPEDLQLVVKNLSASTGDKGDRG